MHTVELPSRLPGRDERACGGASFRDFARERKEDAVLFGASGLSADGAGSAPEAGRVH